jgi:hypothetical protein
MFLCVCVWIGRGGGIGGGGGFETCKLPGYLRLYCGHRKKFYGSVLEVSRCLSTFYLLRTPVAYVNEPRTLFANERCHQQTC